MNRPPMNIARSIEPIPIKKSGNKMTGSTLAQGLERIGYGERSPQERPKRKTHY